MEAVPTTFVKSLMRGQWRGRRRNGYERLGCSRRCLCPETSTVALEPKKPGGGYSHRRRRFWRIRVGKKLQLFRWCSPKKWVVRFRDAYVKMMLSLANTRTIGTRYAGSLESGYYGSGRYRYAGPAVKEYDEKMIVQIYRMIVAQSRLAPQNGVAVG